MLVGQQRGNTLSQDTKVDVKKVRAGVGSLRGMRAWYCQNVRFAEFGEGLMDIAWHYLFYSPPVSWSLVLRAIMGMLRYDTVRYHTTDYFNVRPKADE